MSVQHPHGTRQHVVLDVTLPAGANLVQIPDGDGERFRKGCRSGQYICPYEDCPDRRLILRAGSKVRHHVAHHPGTSHSGESLRHLAGKAMLAEIAGRAFGADAVRTEVSLLANSRRADVHATTRSGSLALEAQASSIGRAEFQQRRDDYAGIGRDAWFWVQGGRLAVPGVYTDDQGVAHEYIELRGVAAEDLAVHGCAVILDTERDRVGFVSRHLARHSNPPGIPRTNFSSQMPGIRTCPTFVPAATVTIDADGVLHSPVIDALRAEAVAQEEERRAILCARRGHVLPEVIYELAPPDPAAVDAHRPVPALRVSWMKEECTRWHDERILLAARAEAMWWPESVAIPAKQRAAVRQMIDEWPPPDVSARWGPHDRAWKEVALHPRETGFDPYVLVGLMARAWQCGEDLAAYPSAEQYINGRYLLQDRGSWSSYWNRIRVINGDVLVRANVTPAISAALSILARAHLIVPQGGTSHHQLAVGDVDRYVHISWSGPRCAQCAAGGRCDRRPAPMAQDLAVAAARRPRPARMTVEQFLDGQTRGAVHATRLTVHEAASREVWGMRLLDVVDDHRRQDLIVSLLQWQREEQWRTYGRMSDPLDPAHTGQDPGLMIDHVLCALRDAPLTFRQLCNRVVRDACYRRVGDAQFGRRPVPELEVTCTADGIRDAVGASLIVARGANIVAYDVSPDDALRAVGEITLSPMVRHART